MQGRGFCNRSLVANHYALRITHYEISGGHTTIARLTPRQRRTLEAVCEALLPALVAEGGDDPRLFGLSAASVGVAPAMEEALGKLDKAQQTQFRLLLSALDRAATMGILTGKARRFTALRPPDRERALLAMANSRLPLLRTGFQGLKRLALFLYYSVTDSSGHNPTWEPIGYTPSANPPALAPLLALTQVTRPVELECDVCVIGSGAGGSVVAAELAAAGKRVIVLEAGGGWQAPDYDQHELAGMQSLYLDSGVTASRDLGVAILAGATLGGGTAINWQTSLPLPADVREEWAGLPGCGHFAHEAFTRSTEAVMTRLNATTGESQVNPNNATLQRGCEALGYGWQALARNARGCDPDQCGYCVYGCRHGGKQSSAVTYLRDAQATGDTVIITSCRAERVTMSNGRVTGVEAIATGETPVESHRVRVRAPVVAVAAGAIHSPMLLMRSGLHMPALGRNLFLHPTSAVAGVYDAPVNMWCGPPQSVMCDRFASIDGPYGVRFEVAPAHLGLIALALPWHSARDHRRTMQSAAHVSPIILLTRDKAGGRVRLGPGGRPVITYLPGAREQVHIRRGIAEAARIHLAAGAREVRTLHTREQGPRRPAGASAEAVDAFCERLSHAPVDRNRSILFSAHQMGTCRMGGSARTAVCNPEGEVYGVRGLFIADGSAFPASSGVNPMITISALSHHTAQAMKAR
jgi:choline dehydrogenase-like flavoprotein